MAFAAKRLPCSVVTTGPRAGLSCISQAARASDQPAVGPGSPGRADASSCAAARGGR